MPQASQLSDLQRSVATTSEAAASHSAPSGAAVGPACAACGATLPADATHCLACRKSLPHIRTFAVNADTITLGEPLRLHWLVEDATELRLLPQNEIVPLTGAEVIMPHSTTTYTLEAISEAGTRRQALTVTLPPPTIEGFRVNQEQMDLDYPVIFSWEATNAETVTIEPGVGEVSGQSFCEAWIQRPGVYFLRVKNASGEVRDKVRLWLSPPEITQFQSPQREVSPGEPHLLFWEVSNAERLFIEPGIGEVTGTTQVQVYPDHTTTYRLIAENAMSRREAELTLTLPPPRIDSFYSPQPVSTEGEPVTVYWAVSHATRVWMEPGVGELPARGELLYQPTEPCIELRLMVEGPSGTAAASITLTALPNELDGIDERELFKEFRRNLKMQERILREQHRQAYSSPRKKSATATQPPSWLRRWRRKS